MAMTWGDLKRFAEDNEIPDSLPVETPGGDRLVEADKDEWDAEDGGYEFLSLTFAGGSA